MQKKILALGAMAFIPLIASADKINIKTGLWEMATNTDLAGLTMGAMPSVPPDILAKMPPEQRARIESTMASRAPGGGMTNRSCVTEKDLERGLKPETGKEQSCKVDSVKTTGSTQEMHVSCTSAHGNSTGVFKMTATSRESFDGTMEMNINVQNRPMTMKMTLKGKWLGADCGEVKPREN